MFCVCVAHVCLMFLEVRRGQQIPWDCSERQFWAALCVLGTESVFSGRAASLTLRHVSQAPVICMWECHSTFVDIRVPSLLPSFGSWGLNSGCKTWLQAPLLSEPSRWLLCGIFYILSSGSPQNWRRAADLHWKHGNEIISYQQIDCGSNYVTKQGINVWYSVECFYWYEIHIP